VDALGRIFLAALAHLIKIITHIYRAYNFGKEACKI